MDIRPLAEDDRECVGRLLVERWGDSVVVGRGRVWKPAELPGFTALDDGRCVGLVTYENDGEACEIVTIDALEEGKGIGTALLEAVVGVARDARGASASSCSRRTTTCGRWPSTRSGGSASSGSSRERSTRSEA